MSDSVHSHTAATALAGAASKVAVDAAAPSPSGARPARARRSWSLRVVAVFAVMAALVGVGAAPSAFAASSDAANTARAFGGAPDLGPPAGLDLNTPLLDIAAHPGGNGYWLVSQRRRRLQLRRRPVLRLDREPPLKARSSASRPRRAATATGSSAPTAACSPSATPRSAARSAACSSTRRSSSIAATPSGNGYWLVAADGGVFAFGDAEFHGARRPASRTRPIVGMAATPSGHGYYLLAADGGVFAFGDAALRGAAVDAIGPPATAIAASPDGAGYWVAPPERQRAPVRRGPAHRRRSAGSQHPAVGIAARADGGYWIAQGEQPPPPAAAASGPSNLGQDPFLACTRAHESRPGRRLPRGEPGRHVPRCVPVPALDVEQRRAPRGSPRPRRCRPGRGRARRSGPPRVPPVPVAGRGAVGRSLRRPA